MKTRYSYLFHYLLIITDLLVINLAFFCAWYIVFGMNSSSFQSSYRNIVLVNNLVWLSLSSFIGMYRKDRLGTLRAVFKSCAKAYFGHFILMGFYLFFSGLKQDVPDNFIVTFYVCLGSMFFISRIAAAIIELSLFRYLNVRRPVLIIPQNSMGLRLASNLEMNQNYHFRGFKFSSDTDLFDPETAGLVPEVSRVFAECSAKGINDIYVILNYENLKYGQALDEEAEKACVRLNIVPDLVGKLSLPYTTEHMGQFTVISLRHEPLESIQNRFKKRVFDLIFSTLVIICLLSWLVPILAVIIKIQSRGPVFFKQLRSGRNNEPFYCYKFRSMRVNDDSNVKQATKNDDRITPIGRFMRRTSIDELPQFFNVVIGNMSVIGPRPHMLKHTEQYSAIIDQYMVRQFLKPGISGLAQVNGYRGETEDPELMRKRVEYDLMYMESWRLSLDVKLVLLTIINTFRKEERAY